MPLQITASTTSVADSAALYGAAPTNTTANTQEQIFSPILIRKGASTAAAIPSFEAPTMGLRESGPFGNVNGGFVGPTRSELDPYFSNALGDDGSNWIKQCDYQIMINDGQATVGSRDINIHKTNRNISNVTAAALRGPLILSGWGYDIADRPTPAKGGQGANAFKFNRDIVNDRGTWKTGPVNLQWDDERKVWQGGAQIVCGVVAGKIEAPTDPCTPTSFSMKVFRKTNMLGLISDLDACMMGETITCMNRDPSLSEPATPGMIFVIAVRINYEWIPIWVGCPEGPATAIDPVTGDLVDITPPCSDC
jgi:hypothetical protein